MLTQNGSQSTISSQLYSMIAKHGLVNIIDIIRMLCAEQSNLKPSNDFEDCFHHLEKLTKIAAKIETWN